MGFDDHGWLSDSDLKWLVDSGRTNLLRTQTAAQEWRAKRSGQEARGLASRRGSCRRPRRKGWTWPTDCDPPRKNIGAESARAFPSAQGTSNRHARKIAG